MSSSQRRGITLWMVLLSTLICFGFLPVTRLAALAIWFVILALTVAVYYRGCRRTTQDSQLSLDALPDAAYRQPVVLVCGDFPQEWPQTSPVLTVSQGCWIRVEDHQDLIQVARQVLWLRPDWGRQLSVMICVCPQKHAETKTLNNQLLALRWKMSQLRKESGHIVPLVLTGLVGSAITHDILWQSAMPDEGIRVWHTSSAPDSVTAWINTEGAVAMKQQIVMNSLMNWFHTHIHAVFMDENQDLPAIAPAAVLWGVGPILPGCLVSSIWSEWLSRHTAIPRVAGWQPAGTDNSVMSQLPDFVLPLLLEGQGLTPRERSWCIALRMVTLAAVIALLCSGWNNHQLIQRMNFDIARYNRISMTDFNLKADAVAVLRDDAMLLDNWARNGAPVSMGLGLYRGEHLRMPILDAIRSYIPPPQLSLPEPPPEIPSIPKIIRLDSMSLFDSGRSELKTGSAKMLINALMEIKAKPGWLIVVAGHTDSTGNPSLNQTLSLKRAVAVRNWMRDTGDVPESCFAVQGYGANRPIAGNDTEEGRALNRRVEISLVPQANACQVPGTTQTLSQDDDVSQHNGE